MTCTKRMCRGGVVAGIAIALFACAKAPEPARTVSWYREHAAERQGAVKQCVEDPGASRTDRDCVNALRAASLEDIGSFEKLPPMGLNPGTADPDPDDARARVRPD